MSAATVFLLLALLAFVAAALNHGYAYNGRTAVAPRVNLIAVGLALLTVALLLPSLHFS